MAAPPSLRPWRTLGTFGGFLVGLAGPMCVLSVVALVTGEEGASLALVAALGGLAAVGLWAVMAGVGRQRELEAAAGLRKSKASDPLGALLALVVLAAVVGFVAW